MLEINSLYNDKQTAFKCVHYFYKTFHVVFGLDFGFFKNKCLLYKLCSMLECTFYCVLGVFNMLSQKQPLSYGIWYLAFFSQYFVSALMLTCIKNDLTFCNIFYDLRTIDLGLKVSHASYNLESKLLFSIFACLWLRFTLYVLYCEYFGLCSFAELEVPLYFCIFFALDVILISCAFMFFAINCRLKKLASLVLAENSNFLSLQHLYKSIVDIAEKHKTAISPVFFFSLLYNVPDAMASIYFSVQIVFSNEQFTYILCIQYTIVIEMITLTILPALCAGMLSTQAERIKLILHDKLLQPRGSALALEIERFIRYVEARDCQFRVWKLIPLDAHLLGMVLNFCVTYLIVIIQFTNTLQ